MMMMGGTFPVTFTSDSIRPRSISYASPLPYSLNAVREGVGAVLEYAPPNGILTGSFTGVASVDVGLPGAPGVAAGDLTYCRYNFFVFDVGRDANVAATPFTLRADYVFDGSGFAGTFPETQYVWEHTAVTGWIVVIIARSIDSGPYPCVARLTTSDWSGARDDNGAANMAAGDMLTGEATAAAAGTEFVVSVGTANHESFPAFVDLVNARSLTDAPAIGAAVKARGLVTERGARLLEASKAAANRLIAKR
jgi:hypothetical protein